MTEIALSNFSGVLKIGDGLAILKQSEGTIEVILPATAKPAEECEFLEQAANVYQNCHGCSTPLEEFIWRQIRSYGRGTGITPDHILEDLETFRQDFDDAVRDSLQIVKRYPDLFRDAIKDAPKAA